MSKITTLNRLDSLSNEQSAVAVLNDNSDKIEAAIDNTLSRDGSTPNAMESDLDMNSNRILNLPSPLNPTEPVRLQDVASPVDINFIDNTVVVSNFMKTVLDDASASAAKATLAIPTISTYAETLLDDTSASAAQSTLGISTFIKTLLDDVDAATARATLGVQDTQQPTPLTITVGSGGNYSTLNQAINHATTLHPLYSASSPAKITISLLTGYVETQGVNAADIDLSYITITSVDATVTATVSGDLFHGDNAKLPRIACKFNMGHSGGHGIFLSQADVIVAGPGAGIINAGKTALFSIAMGRFTILDADFRGANNYGGYINHNSYGEIGDTDFSGAGVVGGVSAELGDPYNGLHVRHSSRVNLTGACNFRLNGVSNQNLDVRTEFGGIVDLDYTLFLGGVFQVTNLVTQHGVIFSGNDGTDQFTVLSSGTLPSANAVTFTSIPSWVKRLQFDVNGLSHDAGASRVILVRLSTDNGVSYASTNYIHMERTSAPADFSGTDTLVLIAPALAAADTWSGTITIEGLNDGYYTQGRIQGSTGSGVLINGQGIWRGSNARINAIQIIINGTGNFDGSAGYALRGFPN